MPYINMEFLDARRAFVRIHIMFSQWFDSEQVIRQECRIISVLHCIFVYTEDGSYCKQIYKGKMTGLKGRGRWRQL